MLGDTARYLKALVANTQGSLRFSGIKMHAASHHQAYLFPGGQPLQKLAAQLVTEDAGLAKAALQGLLILPAGVRAPPRGLEDIVDDPYNIFPQAGV